MIVDVLSILSQYGQSTVAQIQQNLASSGTNATGKTSRSLRFEVINQVDKQILHVIGARPFFMTVETGRKATPSYKPSPEFVQAIKEWADAKGVEGSPYAIAQAIHNKGTKLFQKGGRHDIVGSVINQTLIDNISKDILSKFAAAYLDKTVNFFAIGTNITQQATRT